MTSTDQIKALLAESTKRAEAATDGPWIIDPNDTAFVIDPAGEKVADTCIVPHRSMQEEKDTAVYIANSRTDLPARDAALRVAVDALQETVDRWEGVHPFDGEDADYLKPCADHVNAHEYALSAILAILKGEK